MSAKHTPGPWRVGEMCRNEIRINHGNDQPGAIGPIAHVYARVAEGEANARLIAAAPELLEALENLISPHVNEGDTGRAVQQARAAIAKAEGRAK